MRMQIFRVKKPSCKSLKAKNCVPFEVQYTDSVLSILMHGVISLPDAKSYDKRIFNPDKEISLASVHGKIHIAP